MDHRGPPRGPPAQAAHPRTDRAGGPDAGGDLLEHRRALRLATLRTAAAPGTAPGGQPDGAGGTDAAGRGGAWAGHRQRGDRDHPVLDPAARPRGDRAGQGGPGTRGGSPERRPLARVDPAGARRRGGRRHARRRRPARRRPGLDRQRPPPDARARRRPGGDRPARGRAAHGVRGSVAHDRQLGDPQSRAERQDPAGDREGVSGADQGTPRSTECQAHQGAHHRR